MCARRFLMLIVILTLIFVGGAFALYQFGDRVLVRVSTPTGHYQEPPKGSGPDYSKAGNWLAKPGLPNDPSHWTPEGAIHQHSANRAATFFIHPTTYLERDRWNAPLTSHSPTVVSAPSSKARLRELSRDEGDERIRTAVRGFAGLCLTTRPRRPAGAS